MDSTLPTQYAMHVEVFSHGFRVSRFNDTIRRLLVEYCRVNFVTYESERDRNGHYVTRMIDAYATTTLNRDQYFFHRNVLDDFYRYMLLHGYQPSDILRTDRPMYEPASVAFQWMRHDVELYDYQHDIIQYCDLPLPRTKMVTLQAGKGKSLSLMGYMNHAQLRTVLIMKPMYMRQWRKELLKTFELKKGDFYYVEGSEALKDLIALSKTEDFNPQVILISNATYRMFLRYFHDHPHTCKEVYGCLPWEFFEYMQAGIVSVDESHQEFHFNFITHCMSHMYKYVAMSATMKSGKPGMMKYYRIMFPADTFAPSPPLVKYIDVYSVFYRFERPDHISYIQRNKYSQNKFEKSILRRKRILTNYCKMVVDMVRYQFFKHPDYKPGQKILVFCDMITMCTEVKEALSAAFPDKHVVRFCASAKDPESNLYDDENDIIVTTLKSCGTARDVANVMVCLCTVAVDDLQSTEQLIHRLREPKPNSRWYGITPRFIFLINRDNEKHLRYYEGRHQKLKHVVKNFNQLSSPFVV